MTINEHGWMLYENTSLLKCFNTIHNRFFSIADIERIETLSENHAMCNGTADVIGLPY